MGGTKSMQEHQLPQKNSTIQTEPMKHSKYSKMRTDVAGDNSLLGYSTTVLYSSPMFQRCILPPLSGWRQHTHLLVYFYETTSYNLTSHKSNWICSWLITLLERKNEEVKKKWLIVQYLLFIIMLCYETVYNIPRIIFSFLCAAFEYSALNKYMFHLLNWSMFYSKS
jgi:hypothetical protein